MQCFWRVILRPGWIVALAILAGPRPGVAQEPLLYAAVGDITRPPVGWVEFCAEHVSECKVAPSEPRSVVLSLRLWRDLVRINQVVNANIRPMTDLEHYGVVEKWAYPDDGYGDCEDYVLLKRRMLMEAGWPREALLITVVRETSGDGHAVLTVRTDHGDFVLDNQNEAIVLWSESGYRFVKRQSQSDPNVWVSLGDPRPSAATATSR
ncbi:MAG: transglutaminase [Alphaproteobacteria bacterium]|nr:MAG: transglutaminase [Alphaproteobacteria bacterium]